ncbi:MAG TPA: hypothetical protein VHE54_12085 [Puia sp.]|nr:hypothetical protein [Puia sp.]
MEKQPKQMIRGGGVAVSVVVRGLAVSVALSLTLASAGYAQTKVLTAGGLRKLDVFVGTWRGEATDSANAGKISAINTCRWSPNGGFLIADQAVNMNGRKTNNLSIYSWNPATDDYTLTLVGIPGSAPFTVPIAYRGDTLIYHSAYTDNGRRYYTRTLNIFSSPDRYTYLIQSSEDSVHWQTNGQGRSQKIATQAGAPATK